MSKLLDSINGPGDLRRLSIPQLKGLAGEIRELIIQVVSQNGGHLSSNLGVVELTIALHYCFDFLKDRLIWDVGHQAYTHKILTGRRETFPELRSKGGLSGFADKEESPYDIFSFGHTGTSLSAGLGLACARDLVAGDPAEGKKSDHPTCPEHPRVVAVIGDGAVSSGMSFEALNHAGSMENDLLFVLNDNRMSISAPVGGLARYLSQIRSSAAYLGFKREVHDLLSRWRPALERVEGLFNRLGEGIQSALTPGGLFVELGFHYYGPVDGHDVAELIKTFERLKRVEGPVLLHVLTEKGRGFEPARNDPTGFHSSGRFELRNGKLVPPAGQALDCGAEAKPRLTSAAFYSEVLSDTLLELAAELPRLVTITAAMPDGTGLSRFAERYPDRFYDVGICEQHAVGFAGGLAAGGLRPVVCIYSTFLQRAYDQIFHDVVLQKAAVVFCVDRAGMVGSDGPSHHGLYDVASFRCMPGAVLMAPADAEELRAMLRLALSSGRPCAIRYPREIPPKQQCGGGGELSIGKAAVCRQGKDAAIIAYGAMVVRALEAADILSELDGRTVTVLNARFAKPLDKERIVHVVRDHPAVLVAEDHALAGGFGAGVLEALAREGIGASHVRLAGAPDRFVEYASRDEQLASVGIDGPGLADRLRRLMGAHSGSGHP